MTSDTIRVIIADDHDVVRSGLRSMLAGAKDITVVCDASDGEQAVELCERFRPHVLVLDLSMQRMDGIEATRAIVRRGLETRVLILTMHSEEEYLLTALDAGANGYLVKSAAERELVDAVRALAHGEMYVQPRAARVLSGRHKRGTTSSEDEARFALLTERERAVLRLIAEGYSAPDIGDKLDISPKTVDTYKQRITDKIGVSGRPDYVLFALRVGLLSAQAADSDRRLGGAHRAPPAHAARPGETATRRT